MEFNIILPPEKGGKCYVCTASLSDYLHTLNDDFYDFEVQRGIVRNTYLDTLTDTIGRGELIPPIVLVSKDKPTVEENSLIVPQTDILDGLQRTFRLWSFYRIKQFIENNNLKDYKQLIDFMKNDDEGRILLDYDFIKPKLLRRFFSENLQDKQNMMQSIEKWKTYPIVFYIWFDLTDKETINKMLELNAGQKSVSSTHQYELLFLHFFNSQEVSIPDDMTIYRAKERVKYKNKRVKGCFQLSSLIVSYMSFLKKKPLRVDPVNELNRHDEMSNEITQIEEYFKPENLSIFLDNVYKIDQLLCTKDKQNIDWYGKDTTLAGIYAAFGEYLEGRDPLVGWNELFDRIQTGQLDFKCDKFKEAYKFMSSMTVNVGNSVRKGIYQYTINLLNNKPKPWDVCLLGKGGNE